jgi:hypothetical protein
VAVVPSGLGQQNWVEPEHVGPHEGLLSLSVVQTLLQGSVQAAEQLLKLPSGFVLQTLLQPVHTGVPPPQ